jgi:hypothetical protein
LCESSSIRTGKKILAKFTITSTNNSIRATIRIVHLNLWELISHSADGKVTFAYPMWSINFLTAMGMIVPPIDDPTDTIPNTKDLRF